MKKIPALFVLFGSAASAQAASTTVGPFTLTGPVSTGCVCAPTSVLSGSPLTGLASAAPAGTVLFTCTVLPAGWQGTVSPPASPALQVVNMVDPGGSTSATFGLSMIAAGIPQTYAAEIFTPTP